LSEWLTSCETQIACARARRSRWPLVRAEAPREPKRSCADASKRSAESRSRRERRRERREVPQLTHDEAEPLIELETQGVVLRCRIGGRGVV
jgi:hypothetical protein